MNDIIERTPFIAGNWKMFKTIAEARDLIARLVPGLQPIKGVQKVLCPPFTALLAIKALLEGTDIGLGGQNLYWEESGAFTGEISPAMIAELCQYVIIGHSERRAYFDETDEIVQRKVQAALKYNLIPIMCVGETLVENEAGHTSQVVERQVREGLRGMDLAKEMQGYQKGTTVPLVIAYEPVWAIGTGRAATSEGANAVVAETIRPVLNQLYGPVVAQAIRVLYGGSVKANNAREFFQQPEIDGALVGGASLIMEEFLQIVQAAA